MSEIQALVNLLPVHFRDRIDQPDDMVEFILDLGRPFEIRYPDSFDVFDDLIVSEEDLKNVEKSLSAFGPDNRAGVDETLHRISRIVTRSGETVGFTCRVGRHIPGSSLLIQQFLDEGKSVLLIGSPGQGKTTMLRDAANYLSTDSSVVIVDTSNEIAGEGRIPHRAVGRARRLQVPKHKSQADVMIEAVENHTPEVIIIDEISTVPEAEAARTIAERGVQLIATAHGHSLEDFMMNAPLRELAGGINVVTITDALAEGSSGRKTKHESKFPPTFDVIVEIKARDEVWIHPDAAEAIKRILDGMSRDEKPQLIPQKWRLLGGEPRLLNPQETLQKSMGRNNTILQKPRTRPVREDQRRKPDSRRRR